METIDTFASYEVGYGLVTALDIVSLHRGVQVAELCLVFEPSSPTLEVASKDKLKEILGEKQILDIPQCFIHKQKVQW